MTVKAIEVTFRYRQRHRQVASARDLIKRLDAILSGMIAEFQNRFPEIKVVLTYGYFAQLASQIRALDLDLAITPIDSLKENAGLTFTEILP